MMQEGSKVENNNKPPKLSKVGSFFKSWKKGKSKDNIEGAGSPPGRSQRSRSLDHEALQKSGLREFLLRVIK
jgi:hypothetical protein